MHHGAPVEVEADHQSLWTYVACPTLVVDQTGCNAVLDSGTFEIFNSEVGIGMIVEELDVPARRGGEGKENQPQINTDELR